MGRNEGWPKQAWILAFGGGLFALLPPTTSVGRQVAFANQGGVGALFRPAWVPNYGQVDSRVAFYANTFAGTAAVLRDGRVSYTVRQAGRCAAASELRRPSQPGCGDQQWTIFEELEGGKVRMSASDPGSTVTHWFLGSDPRRWRSNVPTFSTVKLGEVWAGIEAELRCGTRDVERVFVVSPSGRVESIRLRLKGATGLRVESDGSLRVDTGLGAVHWSAPVAYQVIDGQRRDVPVRYRVLSGSRVAFSVGEYDRSVPLVIDPYLSATFLGGAQDDVGYAVVRATVLSVGQVFFVAGETASPSFPGASWMPGYQGTKAGGRDAFVARLAGTGPSALNQISFFGGGNDDVATAIGVDGDPASWVFVAGTTQSSDLPETTGNAQATAGGGGEDGFVARFTPDLSSVEATYLGGSGQDSIRSVAIFSGEVFVGGTTTSDDLPGKAGGGQDTRAGGQDMFVARLQSDLSGIAQSTYLGGSGDDLLAQLVVDGSTLFIGGATDSPDFPAVLGGAQSSLAGLKDGVLAKMSPSLVSSPVQATYFGGSGYDQVAGIAVVGPYVYAAGWTDSGVLPGTTGSLQPTYGGGPADGFVLRVDNSLSSGVVATFFGGTAEDRLNAIQASGAQVVTVGTTGSSGLPGLSDALQPLPGGNIDGAVATFSSDLSSGAASFFGGAQLDELHQLGVFTDLYGLPRLVVVGATESDNVPGTDFAAQPSRTGGKDAVVAELPLPAKFHCPVQPVSGCLQPVSSTVTIQDRTGSGPDPNAKDKFSWTWRGSATTSSFEDFGNPMIGGRTSYLLCAYDASGLVEQVKLALRLQPGGICGAGGQACWKRVLKKGTQLGYAFRDPTLAQSGVSRVLLRRHPTNPLKDIIKFTGRGGNLALPAPVSPSQYAAVDATFRVQLLRNDGARCWETVWSGTGVRRNTATLFKAVCGGKGQPPC
ncbi:MAG: hypothetical protein N3C12_01000 [Candidatus Binatia bacterium]|nr:hypothetical protein [Candidatus Binatia bacterium]